jgi:hypothetical protein
VSVVGQDGRPTLQHRQPRRAPLNCDRGHTPMTMPSAGLILSTTPLWQRSTECVDGDSLDLEMGSLKGESWRPAIGASQHSEQPSRTERKKEAGEKDETISWSWVGLALFKDFKPVSLCNWAVLTFLKQRSVPHFFT